MIGKTPLLLLSFVYLSCVVYSKKDERMDVPPTINYDDVENPKHFSDARLQPTEKQVLDTIRMLRNNKYFVKKVEQAVRGKRIVAKKNKSKKRHYSQYSYSDSNSDSDSDSNSDSDSGSDTDSSESDSELTSYGSNSSDSSSNLSSDSENSDSDEDSDEDSDDESDSSISESDSYSDDDSDDSTSSDSSCHQNKRRKSHKNHKSCRFITKHNSRKDSCSKCKFITPMVTSKRRFNDSQGRIRKN